MLIVEPIYNADGNDHFAPQATNRTEQNGPEIVGERPNGQHLDLNRDFIKAETPETRMTLGMFRDWDPDVFVDLHTTDGSFHGYALTYAPSLNPARAVFAGPYTRDSLLPVLRQRMHDRDHFEIFDYGNFEPERAPGIDTAPPHLAHVRRAPALRHELRRAPEPHLHPERGVLARPVRAPRGIDVRIRA